MINKFSFSDKSVIEYTNSMLITEKFNIYNILVRQN